MRLMFRLRTDQHVYFRSRDGVGCAVMTGADV